MSDVKTERYSIGELSKMVSISTDTLRYYDEIGLLKPAFTSDETGYRYYTIEQIAAVTRIKELKQYGFSLTEIKEMLTLGEISLTDVYLNRYWALERDKQRLQEAIDKLLEKVKQRQEDTFMKKKILLVDDAAFIRAICRDILQKEGYEVVGEAEDGKQGVEMYKILQPDLVLLNIVMPNMDGIESLKLIREFDHKANVVMCSALARIKPVTQALIAGARDFIVKPFQAESLLMAVRNSFLSEKAYDQETLKRILTINHDENFILSQEMVCYVIEAALSEKDSPRVNDIMLCIGNPHKFLMDKSSVYSNKSDESHGLILKRLENLEKTQDEILTILRKFSV